MTEFERMQAFSYLDGAADGLKEARNDVIEELEKIRNEITMLWVFNRENVVEVIDHHIAELKGETE